MAVPSVVIYYAGYDEARLRLMEHMSNKQVQEGPGVARDGNELQNDARAVRAVWWQAPPPGHLAS